jgi:Fe-S-cluster containining protein
LKFQNVAVPDSIGFRCRNCGACCRVQPPDVDKNEREQIEAKGFRDFLDRPDETGTRWIRRKNDGSCFFLGKDNRCTIYSVRPAICRLEPFTIVDYDYEKNRIDLELNFPSACGCEGVFEGETLSVEDIGRAAQVVVQKILALTAKDMGLPATDRKVPREARSRILRSRIMLADLQIPEA